MKSRPDSRVCVSAAAMRAGSVTAPTCRTPWAMQVIELKTLHLRAVDQRRMDRRKLPVGAPDAGGSRLVEAFQCLANDTAPFQIGAVNGAAERIQNKQLEPVTNLSGNMLIP